jgi:hypothetical protein
MHLSDSALQRDLKLGLSMFGEDLKRAPSLQRKRYGPTVRPNVDVGLICAKCGVCKVISFTIAEQSSEGPLI